jgi:hypothetical protein
MTGTASPPLWRHKTACSHIPAQRGGAADRAGSQSRPAAAKPALLAGGNPQIAKADGDAPVQAYIAADSRTTKRYASS